MNFHEKKFPTQVLFWALLGPFFVGFTFLLALIKGHDSGLILSFIALIGLPMIWRGGLKGVGLMLFILFGLVTYEFLHIPISERFWLVGSALSTSISLMITALSLEEVRSNLSLLQQEAARHLKASVELDTKMEKMRKEMKAERRAWNEQLQWQQELAATARKDFVKLTKEKEKVENQLANNTNS